ncbi:anhydro-N-acetylmuramic acid kinase [Diaphorobacter aerolatus]|uniref:Anhydro-N-acetylmuramic acid kinase n=1 Tax=Diaphorobacter aerolatus TaxID=1288495 RepID=A0A7H0GNQ2_9BURK|nr:anhydro-N-acetylmuramic acid kinase [Diaphorobacter aerolatus]QNP49918.1 anhydro-N-acetylmuramic acid kinase [Diaphorobacter aerolatus]
MTTAPGNPDAPLFIGLMSGTSLDGVDGVLVAFSPEGKAELRQHASSPFTDDLRAELLALNTSGTDELHRSALAANGLVRTYARIVQELLAQAGVAPSDVAAMGAHGQTVRHRPREFDGTGYTLQLNNPALLAELTGITVVADFRTRDVAAGGQGAPLVPAFHAGVFGRSGETVAVLNLGGIANLSILRADGGVLGFDCGPANALMDFWCHEHTGQWFDARGDWAAQGRVVQPLLGALLEDPYFRLEPPKSTGRDLFHPEWLRTRLATHGGLDASDVQATLAELTAISCADDLKRHAPDARELIVCGGGALNDHLMRRLQAHLPGVTVQSSLAHGIDPQQVEAAAFAWLARQCLLGLPGNLASVTGARGARVLGAIHPV